MRGDQKLYKHLADWEIPFEYFEHEAIPTIADAIIHKAHIPSTHCKNIFLRNHKGNQHFLILIEQNKTVDIRKIELLLLQGKLSFASEDRLFKYLGLKPGSVSPFGLVHDTHSHVKVFIDEELKYENSLSFHPNVNDASLVVSISQLLKFIEKCGNPYTFIDLSIKAQNHKI